MKRILCLMFCVLGLPLAVLAQSATPSSEPHVAILDMNMMILPGTGSYLERSIDNATKNGAKVIIVQLNTPGGLLQTSQEMIQTIFRSKTPVVIYVGPSGATATSAGVFITLAGHIAAMAPGTTIGAAHPVSGDGKNLESDMRAKAENMTVAMVKSISEQRGRNIEWAESSVKESASITEKEALEKNVIDLVASDFDDLLKKISGKEITVDGEKVVLDDYSALPRHDIPISSRDQLVNVLANPNVAALLWLAATTGLSIELYNPGAILPGVVGVICLILALAVSQVIPINTGAILLFVVGALLIGAEFYIASGILGLGGIIAMVLGAVYLLDVSEAPGMAVDYMLILPTVIFLGACMVMIVWSTAKAYRHKVTTGSEGLVGLSGRVTETVAERGKVFVNGEIWNAETASGVIEKGAEVRIKSIRSGMVLEVERV
ncbi:MAG: nodulation protein NfeD [Bdellovibrionales bacterium]|nr:nodulation protein NfeD [Bdellovibrionales bacterium]